MTDHACDAAVFDRNPCSPPCPGGHFLCGVCGRRQDPCWWETPPAHDSETYQFALIHDAVGDTEEEDDR